MPAERASFVAQGGTNRCCDGTTKESHTTGRGIFHQLAAPGGGGMRIGLSSGQSCFQGEEKGVSLGRRRLLLVGGDTGFFMEATGFNPSRIDSLSVRRSPGHLLGGLDGSNDQRRLGQNNAKFVYIQQRKSSDIINHHFHATLSQCISNSKSIMHP